MTQHAPDTQNTTDSDASAVLRERLDARGYASLASIIPDPANTLPTLVSVSAGAGSSEATETISPTSAMTNSVISTLPRTPTENVPGIVARARDIQRDWAANTTIAERAKKLLRFHDLVIEHREELIDLVQWENGKDRASALEEITDVCLNSTYYAKTAERTLAPQRAKGAIPVLTKTTVRYQPKGVVAVISPWNYPLTLAISDAIPALIAGNSVVIKPDATTPHSALAAKYLLERAGFPKDLFQVILGPGRELGSPMIENSDYLMFTGSTKTGRTVAAQAGEALIDFSAELGGKNPLIVRSSANIRDAAKGTVRASYSNSGQLCISIERVYVHQDVWDEFVPALIEEVEALTVGTSFDWTVTQGPLISDQQLDTVEAHIADAVEKGATVLTGGHRINDPARDASGRGFAPTVLTDVPEDATLFASETFGPVISLYKVRDDADALRRANDTGYGLNASIYTGWNDTAAAEKLAEQVKSGSVNVNEGYVATWASTAAPVGGVKASGISHRHGPAGIIKYCDGHVTAVQHLMPITRPSFLTSDQWSHVMKGFLQVKRYLPGPFH